MAVYVAVIDTSPVQGAYFSWSPPSAGEGNLMCGKVAHDLVCCAESAELLEDQADSSDYALVWVTNKLTIRVIDITSGRSAT